MKTLLLLATLAVSAFGQLTDFTVDINPGSGGPTHIVPGYTMYFKTIGANFVGSDDHQVTLSVSGLPSGVTAVLYTSINSCCGSNRIFRAGTQNVIQLNATGATTPGNSTVTVQYFIATTGLTKSNTFTLTVDAVPIPPGPPSLTAPPTLTSLAAWNSHRLSVGTTFCVPAQWASTSESLAWYYDGSRNYIQLFNATKDPVWLPCILGFSDFFQTYVSANSGSIPGWRNFAKGLALYHNMTGVSKYKTAATQLKTSGNSVLATLYDPVSWVYSREIAYALETEIVNEVLLGGTPSTWKNVYADLIFGHFNQWFVQLSAADVQPFMVALSSEALIDYYNLTGDPRVLPAVKLACDWLWANRWDPMVGVFAYDDNTGPPDPDPTYINLNLLILPMYGWVYRMTGDDTYRTNGDTAFNAGVVHNDFFQGRNYTQQYRWSDKYVEWRDLPAAATSRVSGGGRVLGGARVR